MQSTDIYVYSTIIKEVNDPDPRPPFLKGAELKIAKVSSPQGEYYFFEDAYLLGHHHELGNIRLRYIKGTPCSSSELSFDNPAADPALKGFEHLSGVVGMHGTNHELKVYVERSIANTRKLYIEYAHSNTQSHSHEHESVDHSKHNGHVHNKHDGHVHNIFHNGHVHN